MKVAIAFLGNIQYDTRARNFHDSLIARGHDVRFIGYDWDTIGFKPIQTDTVSVRSLRLAYRLKLFYASFTIRTFFSLITGKMDVLIASDFFALPVCVLIAKLKKARLFYDSREIYTELTSLNGKPWLKKLYGLVEKQCVRSTHTIFTTGEMDTEILKAKYPFARITEMHNYPQKEEIVCPKEIRQHFPELDHPTILIYQGVLAPGLGIETTFKAMRELENCALVLLGEGAYFQHYQTLAQKIGIRKRTWFAGRVSQNELLAYTAACDIGLSVIDNISGNCYYALPNKLFAYLMAGLPVIVTDLPQMKKVVETYQVGACVPDQDFEAIVRVVREWRADPERFRFLKKNCKAASEIFHWEREFDTHASLFEKRDD